MGRSAQVNGSGPIQIRRGRVVAAIQRRLLLVDQTPVVDPLPAVRLQEGPVRGLGPLLPPLLQERSVVPGTILAGEAVRPDAPGRQEHVRMRVPGAAVMVGHVGDHAEALDLALEAPLEVARAFGLLDCDPDSAEALDVAGRPWLVLVSGSDTRGSIEGMEGQR